MAEIKMTEASTGKRRVNIKLERAQKAAEMNAKVTAATAAIIINKRCLAGFPQLTLIQELLDDEDPTG